MLCISFIETNILSEDFSEILWSSSEIVETQTVYPSSGAEPLVYDQLYYWRVRCLGEEAAIGDFSEIFKFDISGSNKVVLEGPLSEESESLLPYFSWEPINGAAKYIFKLASDESMSTIIYTTDASEVFLQYLDSAPPLNNGIAYYWTVIAMDENGSAIGDESDVGLFNTPVGLIELEFIFDND